MTTTLTKSALSAAALLASLALATSHASASEQNVYPTASFSCIAPDAAASMIAAPTPEPPAIAVMYGLTGSAVVNVQLNADGSIGGTSIAKTSGSPTLDGAALAAANASSFRPEVRDCAPVSGSYLFEVDFPQ